ncbi:hypothetical protein [Stenotrophomonas maltophilia]|uniref:hypothetical protein n=1 Tax=Stenotrophomonas maltophilia TaxID=40324 RepID=UPI003D7DF05B
MNFVRDESAARGCLQGGQAYLDEAKRWESRTFLEDLQNELSKPISSGDDIGRLVSRAVSIRRDPYGVAAHGAREDEDGEQARQRDQERATRFYPNLPQISGLPARRYELNEANAIFDNALSLLDASPRGDLREVRHTIRAQRELIAQERLVLNPILSPLMERQPESASPSMSGPPPAYVPPPDYANIVGEGGRPNFLAGGSSQTGSPELSSILEGDPRGREADERDGC